jgi:hypothetical protein
VRWVHQTAPVYNDDYTYMRGIVPLRGGSACAKSLSLPGFMPHYPARKQPRPQHWLSVRAPASNAIVLTPQVYIIAWACGKDNRGGT